MKLELIHILVDPKLKRELEKLSESTDASISGIVRNAIRKYLKEKP